MTYKRTYKISQSNRGKQLEQKFKDWMKCWHRSGRIFAVRLEVHQTAKGIRTEKQPCDFIVTEYIPYGDELITRVVYIDTKECRSKKFYPKKQAKHQLDHIRAVQSAGGEAGFLVWFREDGCGTTPKYLRWITNIDEPATVDSGEAFDPVYFFGNCEKEFLI